jgi:DNA-binding response OmpR family regulator
LGAGRLPDVSFGRPGLALRETSLAVKVLVIEDTLKLAAAISEAMSRAQYACEIATNLRDAQNKVDGADYDIILLDLSLPDGDGLDFLRKLRAASIRTPVIVLTARGGLNDRISGLDDGADDYLVKPFELGEMVSRCKAVLRRTDRAMADSFRVGRLTFDQRSGMVNAEGHQTPLPRRDSQLLAALMRRQGKVCTRKHLEDAVYEANTEVSTNALEASIYRLRAFLTASDAGVEVRTVRGVGYVLVAENS